MGFVPFQVSVPVTVIEDPSSVISAAVVKAPRQEARRSKVTNVNAVRIFYCKRRSVIDFAPSIGNILPSNLVPNQVECSVQDWRIAKPIKDITSEDVDSLMER